jgi:hypothetical protein
MSRSSLTRDQPTAKSGRVDSFHTCPQTTFYFPVRGSPTKTKRTVRISRNIFPIMINLADLILTYIPLPAVPSHLTTWQPGKTPLSTTPVVLSVMAGYLTTIFTIQHLLRDKPAYVLNTLFRAHNIILSVGSGILLALMVEEIGPIWWKHGFRYAICSTNAWTPVSTIFCPFRLGASSCSFIGKEAFSALRYALHNRVFGA